MQIIYIYAEYNQNSRGFGNLLTDQHDSITNQAEYAENYAEHVRTCTAPGTPIILDEGDGVRMVW